MTTTEERFSQIERRNRRVEAEKAWETSGTRRAWIFAFTYLVALAWLILINDTDPALKALVPAAGWLLSTLSLPWIKKRWMKHHK